MNIALLCVLIAGVLPVVSVAFAKLGFAYDNHNPREQALRLEGYRKRAYAAHLNAYEAFPLFAAAVIVAHIKLGDHFMIDLLAVTFVVARLTYLACYLLDMAFLRSIVWALGWFLSIMIFCSPWWVSYLL